MASNIFLNLTDIKGESSDAKHSKDIEILNWSHGFNQPTKPTRSTAGSGTVEKANHSELSISKYFDAASRDLIKACWNGQVIKKGTISAYRSDGAKETGAAVLYLEINMEAIVISNFSISGGPGDIPTENISLSYGKVEYKYTPQKHDDGKAGTPLPITHDLMTNVIS